MRRYSMRELVSIVVHLERYPTEGVANVVGNVFDFDSYDRASEEMVGAEGKTPAKQQKTDSLRHVGAPRTCSWFFFFFLSFSFFVFLFFFCVWPDFRCAEEARDSDACVAPERVAQARVSSNGRRLPGVA